MKILNALKKIAYSSTFVFTVTIFVFLGMFSIIEDNSQITQTRAIPLSNYPWILLFSVIVGALDNLLTAKRLPLAIRLPIHLCGVLGAFYVIILRVFGLGQNGRGRFSVMAVAVIVYAIILISAYFLRRAFSKLAQRYSTEINAPVSKNSDDEYN